MDLRRPRSCWTSASGASKSSSVGYKAELSFSAAPSSTTPEPRTSWSCQASCPLGAAKAHHARQHAVGMGVRGPPCAIGLRELEQLLDFNRDLTSHVFVLARGQPSWSPKKRVPLKAILSYAASIFALLAFLSAEMPSGPGACAHHMRPLHSARTSAVRSIQ